MKPAGNNEPNSSLRVASASLLLFLFCAILFSLVHGIEKTGVRPRPVAAYYLGSVEEMSYPRELPTLMESTHVHFFMVPMIYYILCHLFAQTGLANRWKLPIIVATFLNIGGFLTAPYLIRFVSSRFALLVPFHYLVLILTASTLIFFPARELIRNQVCGR